MLAPMLVSLFSIIPRPGNGGSAPSSASTCSGSSINLKVDPNSYCQGTGLPPVGAGSNELQLILQVAFGVLGVVAVLFVVIGGLRYAISEGNPEDMSKAKNTIIYAIVGLVIVLFAEAIVTFTLGFIQ